MKNKHSFSLRFQYWFDNMMSRGTVAQVVLLGVLSLVIVIVAAVILAVFSINQAGAEGSLGLGEAAWQSLMHTLDSGAVGADTGAMYRFVMLLVTFGGIFVTSSLIGVLSAGVSAKLDDLRKGRSAVLEENHTLILGWSSQIFTIISELVLANENQKNPAIVILADRDKVEMEEELAARVPDTGKTRIICRSGSPIDPGDLEIASPQTARSIIILPAEEMPDASVVKTVLALSRLIEDPQKCRIVTQVEQERTKDVLAFTSLHQTLHPLLTGQLIARVTAQTSRQSGLSVVYTELLNFGGDEIYFADVPALTGKTYAQALSVFEDSTVIGIRDSSGTVRLNPAMDAVFAPGDQVIAVSADDDTIKPSADTASVVDKAIIQPAGEHTAEQPERALIIGWNERASVIISELDNYVAPGSEVVVFTGEENIAVDAESLENQSLSVKKGDTTDRALLDELDITSFNQIIVLADTTLPVQAADARTMVTLLHLRDIANRKQMQISIVSEMLDLRNRQLAEIANVDDFIVSDHLVSLLMAQLSENGDLQAVFDDLFDPEGSEIYLKPASDYVQPGKAVNFYTVVEAARQRGETPLGYRLVRSGVSAGGVVTNPKKSQMVTFSPEDKIIVLSEN